MLDQFLKVVGGDRIDRLIADREFIGTDWFAWLRARHTFLHPNPARHAGVTAQNAGEAGVGSGEV